MGGCLMSQITLNGDTSNYVAIATPTTITANWTLTLPQNVPSSSGSFLSATTAGVASWTTATFPSTATSTGTILRADGTNWVASTATYPNTATAGTFLVAATANTISATATPTLGVAGTTAGTLTLSGATSGTAVLQTSAAAGSAYTWTLQNPGVNVNIGFLEVPQVSKTTNYTTVLTDSGKHIYANGTSITITIDSNTNVAYPIGTVLTFVNINSTSLSIAITSDTMYLAGSGTTGTRALAQYGMATALKLTSTTWLISGTGLT